MQHPLKQLILILISACALVCPTGAHAAQYLCRYLGVDRGLTNSNATAVTRDGRGFLWIGTRYGLNRYDFSQTDNYYHQPNDSHSIPDNNIRQLYCDSQKRLWVATEQGVATYNEASDDFTTLLCQGKPVGIRSMIETSEGMLMGGGGRLYLCRHGANKLEVLPTHGGSRVNYTDILPWYTGKYILATRWDGLWLYDRRSGNIKRLPGVPETDIMACAIDLQGNLWVSPYGRGLFCYRSDGSRSDMITAENSPLTSNRILDLLPLKGMIWIATDGGGVCIYDPIAGKFSDSNLAEHKAVTALYADRHENIYGTTVRDGAMSIRQVAMTSFNRLTQPTAELSAVISMCRDNDGTVWLGDDGNGVIRVDRNGTLHNIASTSGMKVTGIAPLGGSQLLISTFDGGLKLMDKNSGGITAAPAALNAVAQEALSVAVPLHLRPIDANRVVLTSKKIYIYNHADGSLSNIPLGTNAALQPFYNDSRRLMCIVSGTAMEYDITGAGRHRTLGKLPDNRDINCAHFDGKRSLYLASLNSLRRIDIVSGAAKDIPLVNIRRITSILADGDRLWLGSNRSMYLYDQRTGRQLRFGDYDGVQPNEYLPQAKLSTPEALYFGGVNGMLRIVPDDVDRIINGETTPILNVADLTVDGRSVFADINDGRLRLPHSYSSATLRVVADANHYLQRQPVRYYLRGGGQERLIETSDNLLPLNGLQPGEDYELLWSCAMPDGRWTEPKQLLSMAVAIPWYNSIWIRILMILMLGGSVLAYENRRRRTQRLRLERRIAEERNMSMEREIDFLVNTNQALRTPLTMIYAPIKQLLEHTRKHPANVDVDTLELIYTNTKKMRDAMDAALEMHRVTYNRTQQDSPEGTPTLPDPETTESRRGAAGDADSNDEPTQHHGETPWPPTHAQKAVADSQAHEHIDRVDMSHLNALIVEEDCDLCTFLASALTPYFRSVTHTFDGVEAWTLIQESAPDVVIMAQTLPGMSGLELCRSIKQCADTAHIPVILLTAFRDDPERARGYSAGADSHLSKPFDLAVLLARCRNLLHTRSVIRKRYETHKDTAPEQPIATASENFLRRADDVISRHIEDGDLSIDTLMEHMHMSRSSLYGKFKDITGDTPGNYIIAWRIRKAKQLLADRSLTIAEISDRLGFSSQRYFSTFFKEHTGTTPSRFRDSGV